MPITIDLQPDNAKLQQRNYPLIYNVSSDNSDEDGFLFVCDVYVNGSLVSKLKKPLLANQSFTYFEISSVLKNYISIGFKPALSIPILITEAEYSGATIEVFCRFYEFYDGEVHGSAYQTDTIVVYPCEYEQEDFFYAQYSVTKFECQGATREFLTEQKTRRCFPGQSGYVYAINRALTIRTIDYNFYNSAGTLLTNIPYGTTQSAELQVVPFAPATVKRLFGSPILNNVAYYTVRLKDVSSNNLSELLTVTIDDRCSPYDTITLHYANRVGGYDSVAFTRLSRENSMVSRQRYKTPNYNVLENDNVILRPQTQHSFAITTETTITMNSDWMTEQEASYLKYLFSSDDVWLEKDGVYYPVTIQDTNYEKKKHVNDWLINYAVTVQKSINYKRQ